MSIINNTHFKNKQLKAHTKKNYQLHFMSMYNETNYIRTHCRPTNRPI